MTDPGSNNQIALIHASVAAGVKRFAPSEWAGYVIAYLFFQILMYTSSKVRSGIKMYDMKEPVLNLLESINKDKQVSSLFKGTNYILTSFISGH